MWNKTTISVLFALFLPIMCLSQVSDNFNSSLLDTSMWQGDIEDFILEDGLLKLDAPSDKDQSVIYVGLNSLPKNLEWTLDFNLSFNPSNSNKSEIWLYTDDIDLDKANGYVISIGESGSDDALVIQKRLLGQEIDISRGQISNVSTSPRGSLKVLKDSVGNWNISASYEFGVTEIISFSENEIVPDEGFFAIKCEYTATRSDKFFFDNFYIGPMQKDKTSPHLILNEITENTVELTFNESVSQSQVGISNFMFQPDYALINIAFPSQNKILLEGDNSFERGVEYELLLSNIQDQSNNTLDTLIKFFLAHDPYPGEILLNEILFNPVGSGADFVEIINPSDKIISLTNIHLVNNTNNQSNLIQSPDNIKPNEILVFTDDKTNILNVYNMHNRDQIFEQAIPALNNDKGNISVIEIKNGKNTLIDSYDYSEKNHHPLVDDENGVSLERVSLENATQETLNWTSAASLSGFATPGLPNSVSEINSSIGPNKILVTNKVFSPNEDGLDDEAIVSYSLIHSLLANATIYDLSGKEIRDIWQNVSVPLQGILVWDGKNNDGNVVNVGIYILVLEFFNLDGQIFRHKEELVVAKELD